MTNRIQKAILFKYLKLINKNAVTEAELIEFQDDIDNLDKNRVLTEKDIYYQKIEIIQTELTKALVILARKRTIKEMKLAGNKGFCQILANDLGGVNYGNIDLKKLDIDEHRQPSTIDVPNVRGILENLVIPKRKVGQEKDLEKFTAARLVKMFGNDQVHQQYSVGGFLALKTDIDLGNGSVGIEIKIADKLTASEMQRMIGQAVYYKKRYYEENLIVFIGSKHPMNANVLELKKFIEELGVTFVFNEAITI